MKVKRLMASLLCGAIGAATLGLSGCGSAADSGMMDAANANAVAGGSSDLPVVTWKMGSTWGDGNIHFTCDERFSELVSQLTDGRFTITNYPEGQCEEFEVPNNPRNEEAGTRKVPFTRELYIEKSDFAEVPPPKFQRLKPDGEVRLMGAYIVKCNEIVKDDNGEIVEIRCTADLETRNGNPADGRKVRGTIHWVSCEHCVDAEIHLYDKLFTEANMNGIPDGADFKDYLNPDSVQVIDHAKLEESLADAKPGERFQFVRTGYFTPDSKNPHVYNRIVTLKDSFKF